VPFRVVVLIVLVVVVLSQVANNIPELLFSVFVLYAGSGYVLLVMNRIRKKPPAPPPPVVPPDGL
jgi:hypothetical protein